MGAFNKVWPCLPLNQKNHPKKPFRFKLGVLYLLWGVDVDRFSVKGVWFDPIMGRLDKIVFGYNFIQR